MKAAIVLIALAALTPDTKAPGRPVEPDWEAKVPYLNSELTRFELKITEDDLLGKVVKSLGVNRESTYSVDSQSQLEFNGVAWGVSYERDESGADRIYLQLVNLYSTDSANSTSLRLANGLNAGVELIYRLRGEDATRIPAADVRVGVESHAKRETAFFVFNDVDALIRLVDASKLRWFNARGDRRIEFAMDEEERNALLWFTAEHLPGGAEGVARHERQRPE